MPQLQWEDRFEMVKVGTGEYILRRAHAVLTGARCSELADARAEGRTGSMRQYNQLARHLPQVNMCDGKYGPFWLAMLERLLQLQFFLLQALQLHLARQETEPEGWDTEGFNGAFPEGGTYTVLLLLPPTHSSWRDKKNWHTVKLLLAVGKNDANHLWLGPKLQRLISHYCTCRSGARTNSACCHVAAALIAICAPALFLTAKVEEPRISDPEK